MLLPIHTQSERERGRGERETGRVMISRRNGALKKRGDMKEKLTEEIYRYQKGHLDDSFILIKATNIEF